MPINARFLADLPLYVVYAACGTTAATLAKAAIARWGRGERRPAALRMAAGCVALLAAFGLLVVLLEDTDLSVMAPVAIGLNILYSGMAAVLVFHERIGPRRALGLGLIIAGVALIGAGA